MIQNVELSKSTDIQSNYAIIRRSIFFGHSFKLLKGKTSNNNFLHLKQPFWANIHVIFTLISLSNSSSTKRPYHQVLHTVTESHTLQFRCFLSGKCRVRVIRQSILSKRSNVFLREVNKTLSGADFQLFNNRHSNVRERFWSTLTATLLVFLIGMAAVFAYTIRICFNKL